MLISKVHCFFEQSGTFKNEFKKLGIDSEDYDILNDFNETDNVLDLFLEIENAYIGLHSLFDNIKENDLIFAFFPCTRFENQIQLHFRGDMFSIKNWSDEKKLEYDLKLHRGLSQFYELVTKLAIVCLRKRLRLIIENPYSTSHYLTKYWAIKPKIIDMDRRKRGDIFTKPTQYWFFNCQPENNFVLEALSINISDKDIIHCSSAVERSLITSDYANRFIKEFIITSDT